MGFRSIRGDIRRAESSNNPLDLDARRLLGSAVSSQPEDTERLRAGLIDAASNRLSGLEDQQRLQKEQFLTDSAREQDNALAAARRQFAGTGLAGSLQGGRALANVIGQQQANTQRGLLDLQDRGLNQLTALGQLGNQFQAGDLARRQVDFGQASTLANLLQRQHEVNKMPVNPMQQGSSAEDTAGLLGFGLGMGGGGGVMTGALGSILGRRFQRGSLF